MAYADAETMVNESLVRAAVIVYFQQKGENLRRNLGRIRSEQRLGFYWMDRLVEELRQYEAHREQYPTFSCYVPQIAKFYRELALHASGEAAAFDAKCAHVVKMEPFPKHTEDADASIRMITIVTDKPLDPKAGYSINTGIDGSKVPLTGNPEFSADGQHILFRVQLKPSETYSFVLTSLAFATPDGYPLADYMVEFKTK